MPYTRTDKGTAAVTNPRVLLPRRMRAILVSIDGYTDPLRAAQNCSPAEAQSLVDELCQLGYIVANSAPQPAVQGRPLAPQPTPVPYMPVADVKSAVSLMNDFVMQYLPNQALHILFALERLDRIELLQQALPAYASQITSLGAPADRHLKELQRLLGPSYPSHSSHPSY